MKRQLNRNVVIGIALLSLSSMLGCCGDRDRVVTTNTTQSGKDWVESESVQEYRGTDGKRVKEKQFFSEEAKCVGKNGQKIPVDTVDECLKRGGKVIDVVVTDEETVKRK